MSKVLNSFVINGLTYKPIIGITEIDDMIANSGKFRDLYPVVFETLEPLGIDDHKYIFVTDTLAFSDTEFQPFDDFGELQQIIESYKLGSRITSVKIQPFVVEQWLNIQLDPTGSIQVSRNKEGISIVCEDKGEITIPREGTEEPLLIQTLGHDIYVNFSALRECLTIVDMS